MVHVLFTSSQGTFLLNDKLEVVKEKHFSKVETKEYAEYLKENKWIKPELELLRGVKDKVLFLGFKDARQENVSFTQDIKKFEVLSRKTPQKQVRATNMDLSAADFANGYTEDIIVIHTLRTYDEMEHVLNSITMRLKDFAKLFMPVRVDSATEAHDILKLYKNPGVDKPGYPVKDEHIRVFGELAHKVETFNKQMENLQQHLETTMKRVCPNILGVAGALLGARLLSIAGSLKELAFMPYSTIQLLGAEKALFRHLRKGSKSPKHGILLSHSFVASAKKRGRAARLLAEALSKASRMDFFKGKDISKELLENMNKKIK